MSPARVAASTAADVASPDPSVAVPTGLVARTLHAGVRAYRRLVAGRPSPCRYYPSCSTYALEALEVHGAGRGSWLGLRRILRCAPWGGHGIDLVPPRHGADRGDVARRPSPAGADRKVS